MSLLADMKLALRVKAEMYDSEVEMLMHAALADMARVGIRPELLALDDEGDLSMGNPLVKQAVAAYCKSRFGFDNGDAERFDQTYYSTVCDLMHSQASTYLYEGGWPVAPKPKPEPEPEPTEPDEEVGDGPLE